MSLSAKDESVLATALANGDTAHSIVGAINAGTVAAGGSFTAALQDTAGAGAAAGTGVVATEYGAGTYHQTVLTLTNTPVIMTDATTAGNQGTLKVYDFPAGNLTMLGATCDLTTLAGAGGIADTGALVGSVGTAAVGVDNATLTTTEANLIPSTAGTLVAGAGTLKGKSTTALLAVFDGTTTAVDAILNLAVPDAGSSADDTVTVNGTITLSWLNNGDN